MFTEPTIIRGVIEIDALVAWLSRGQTPPPTPARIRFN